MDKYFRLHIGELTGFLENVVIKFDYFVHLMNKDVLDEDTTDAVDYLYYRTLSGDHTLADTPLTIYTPTSDSHVPFTRDLVMNDDGFRKFYQRNTSLLTKYVEEHKEYAYLIKRILDPIDIHEAIAADNFAILSTSSDFFPKCINEYEEQSMLRYLDTFVKYFSYRWYVNTFEVEDLYPLAKWSMMWYLLPLVLLTGRIRNIRTSEVHPYYIWEYLISNGYGDFYKYLGRKQELFLYRNMTFLKKNAGKDFILDILEEVFLTPIQSSTRDIDIRYSVRDRQSEADKMPYAKYLGPNNTMIQSIDLFQDKLYISHLDDRNSVDYKDDVERKLSHSSTNRLLTKFLEIVKNKNYDEVFILYKFILDSVVVHHDRGRLPYTYSLESTIVDVKLDDMTFLDMLNLYNYVCHKRNDLDVIDIPATYETHLAVTASNPPDISTFFSGQHIREADDYVDVEQIMSTFPFVDETFVTPYGISEKASRQFVTLLDYRSKLRHISDSLEYDSYKHVLDQLVQHEIIVLDQPYSTYVEWIDANPNIAEFLGHYAAEDIDEYYVDLIRKILETLCPLDYEFAYLNEDAVENIVFVKKITELFKYITSYNINFIVSETDNIPELPLPDLNGYMKVASSSDLLSNLGDMIISSPYFINFFDVFTTDMVLHDPIDTVYDMVSHTESVTEVTTTINDAVLSTVSSFINCQNGGAVLTEINP